MLFPSGLALVLAIFPPAQRQLAIGIWAAMGGLTGAMGPSLGAGADPGVRLAGGVSLQCAARRVHHPVGWRTLVDSRAEGVPGHVDLISVPLASLGVGALVLAISEGRDWGWSSPAVLISLAVAAGFASAFVVRSKSHPAPLFDLSLFRIRTYRVALVGSVLFAGGFFGSWVLMPSFI